MMWGVGSPNGSYFCNSLTSQLSTSRDASNGNADALSCVPGVEKHLVTLVSGLDMLGDQDQIRKFQRDDDVIARTIQAIEQNINLPQQLAKQKKELIVKNCVLCRRFQATEGGNQFGK